MSRTALKLLEAASGAGGKQPLLLGRITGVSTNVDGPMLGVQKATDDSTWFLWHFEADDDVGFAGFDANGNNLINQHINKRDYDFWGQGCTMLPYSDRILFNYNVGLLSTDTTTPSTDRRYRQLVTSAFYGGTVPNNFSVIGDVGLFATANYSNGVSTSATNPVVHYADLTSTATTIHAGATFPYGTLSNKLLYDSAKTALTNDGTNFWLAARSDNYIFKLAGSNQSNNSNVISRHTVNVTSATNWGIAVDNNNLYVNFTPSFPFGAGQGLVSVDKTSNTINWAYEYDVSGAIGFSAVATGGHGCNVWLDDNGDILVYRPCTNTTLTSLYVPYDGANSNFFLIGTLMCVSSSNGDLKWANAVYLNAQDNSNITVEYQRAYNNTGTHIMVPFGFYAYAGLPIDGSGAGVFSNLDTANNPTGWKFAYVELATGSIQRQSSSVTAAYTTSPNAYYDGTTATNSSDSFQNFTTTFTPGISEKEAQQ